jgi:hypothetical protein
MHGMLGKGSVKILRPDNQGRHINGPCYNRGFDRSMYLRDRTTITRHNREGEEEEGDLTILKTVLKNLTSRKGVRLKQRRSRTSSRQYSQRTEIKSVKFSKIIHVRRI